MDIPTNFLSILKCFICKGYLSCGPIYILQDGNATCGRCNNKITSSSDLSESETTKNEASSIRNIYYEILASTFRFPCQYELFGCPEKLFFSEEPSGLHELSCKYEPYVCPILPNNQCDWRGPWCQLLEHCEQAHPDNILENLYGLEPNFTEDSVETYIITCYQTLFLLRSNISVRPLRVIYSMYLLDDPSKMNLYSLSIDCKRNNLTVCKAGNIGTAEDFLKNKLTFCIINQNYLLLKLGAVAGTICVINIHQISTKLACKFCDVEVENFESNEWICNNCESELQYCQNKIMNCTFKDIKVQKVKKHERYFCKHINKCFDCNDAVIPGKMFQHFDSSAHESSITSKIGVSWEATETPRRTLNYVLLRGRGIDSMLCKYYLDPRQLSLILSSSYSSDQLRSYKCTIDITDNGTEFHQSYVPEFVEDFFWDWRIDIDFDQVRYEPMKLDIKINVEKKD